jgi:hypothetical protein
MKNIIIINIIETTCNLCDRVIPRRGVWCTVDRETFLMRPSKTHVNSIATSYVTIAVALNDFSDDFLLLLCLITIDYSLFFIIVCKW